MMERFWWFIAAAISFAGELVAVMGMALLMALAMALLAGHIMGWF